MGKPSVAERSTDRRDLSVGQRVVRAAVAGALLAVPFVGDRPLGLLSLLPLAAVNPGTTALLGYDPLGDTSPAAVRRAAKDPSSGEPFLRRAA